MQPLTAFVTATRGDEKIKITLQLTRIICDVHFWKFQFELLETSEPVVFKHMYGLSKNGLIYKPSQYILDASNTKDLHPNNFRLCVYRPADKAIYGNAFFFDYKEILEQTGLRSFFELPKTKAA